MSSFDKHIFALHVPKFWNENSQVNSLVKVVDLEIIHRLVKVLRIEALQKFIFFDKFHHGMIEIIGISKKDLTLKILSFENNNQNLLEIIFLLPLLKKEALEEAVYSLAEIGVSKIQLVVTQKSRQKLLHEKEFQRLESIIIAAAEQSKNYVYPQIYSPINL
jgi:RsmE family RNA methyltransferase